MGWGIMAYYNRNCERLGLNTKKMNFLDCGCCAKVLRYDNTVFKEYFFNTASAFRLSSEMFDILKDINNEHFIKLFEIYSDMSLLNLFKYKMKALPFKVDAYTAKYYIDDSINVLNESNDYILDNFRELELLFEVFTNIGIITDDLKRSNAIISTDGIVIIDPDCFYQSSESKEFIAISNKKKLLGLLRSVCSDSAQKRQHFVKILPKIDDLVNIEITENTDVTYEISKKLKYVKKPIDYLTK